MENLGLKLRRVRELKNLKQEYLADALGVSRRQYGNLENGICEMRIGQLLKVCEVLDMPLDDLINMPLEDLLVEVIKNKKTI